MPPASNAGNNARETTPQSNINRVNSMLQNHLGQSNGLDLASLTPSRLEYQNYGEPVMSPQHQTVQDRAQLDMLRQADIEQRRIVAVQTITRIRLTGQLPICQIAEDCQNNAIAICQAKLLCRQLGCGLRLCQKHASKTAKGSQISEGCFSCFTRKR